MYGRSLAEAVRHMNGTLGTASTASRVSEWRRGVYVPSTVAVSYMLSQTLPWALGSSGIALSREQHNRLTDLLWETGVENGEAFVELL